MAYRDTPEAEHEVHTSHHGHYFIVFMALMVLTIISVIADIIHIPSEAVKTVIVMAVAVAKGSCVMLFFMHLKFERNWKYVLLAPTMILAVGLPIALMPDVATRYYIADNPQSYDYEAFMEVHGHHDADAHHGEEGEHAEGEHHGKSHEGESHEHPEGGHEPAGEPKSSESE